MKEKQLTKLLIELAGSESNYLVYLYQWMIETNRHRKMDKTSTLDLTARFLEDLIKLTDKIKERGGGL